MNRDHTRTRRSCRTGSPGTPERCGDHSGLFDDQDRARGAVQDLLPLASHQVELDPVGLECPHHQQVDFALRQFNRHDDFAVAGPQDVVELDAFVHRPRPDFVQLMLAAFG